MRIFTRPGYLRRPRYEPATTTHAHYYLSDLRCHRLLRVIGAPDRAAAASMDWLSEHYPVVHALLLVSDNQSPPDAELLAAINDFDFTLIPEDILRNDDKQFLEVVRHMTPEEARSHAIFTGAYALRPLLISLSLTSAEMPAKLTALLAPPYSPDLDSQMSALALQKAVVQDAADKSAIQQLLGESSESMTTKIQTSLDEIPDLRGCRDALLSSGDPVRIARFRQPAAESGEIEALRQLRRE